MPSKGQLAVMLSDPPYECFICWQEITMRNAGGAYKSHRSDELTLFCKTCYERSERSGLGRLTRLETV